ncbi:unnamed protein product [Leuciscus chuanchicus]
MRSKSRSLTLSGRDPLLLSRLRAIRAADSLAAAFLVPDPSGNSSCPMRTRAVKGGERRRVEGKVEEDEWREEGTEGKVEKTRGKGRVEKVEEKERWRKEMKGRRRRVEGKMEEEGGGRVEDGCENKNETAH